MNRDKVLEQQLEHVLREIAQLEDELAAGTLTASCASGFRREIQGRAKLARVFRCRIARRARHS